MGKLESLRPNQSENGGGSEPTKAELEMYLRKAAEFGKFGTWENCPPKMSIDAARDSKTGSFRADRQNLRKPGPAAPSQAPKSPVKWILGKWIPGDFPAKLSWG